MENPFVIIEARLKHLEEKIDLLQNSLHAERGSVVRDIGGLIVAVEETGLSRHTIYRLVCERRIPHSKRYGRLYFSRKALRHWIEEGQRKTKNKTK